MPQPTAVTALKRESANAARVEIIPAESEKSRANGVEKSRADKVTRVIFTSSAPRMSPLAISKRQIQFASPNFMPGAIKESENRLSIYPKIRARHVKIP